MLMVCKLLDLIEELYENRSHNETALRICDEILEQIPTAKQQLAELSNTFDAMADLAQRVKARGYV